jgi:hypothetical protein
MEAPFVLKTSQDVNGSFGMTATRRGMAVDPLRESNPFSRRERAKADA